MKVTYELKSNMSFTVLYIIPFKWSENKSDFRSSEIVQSLAHSMLSQIKLIATVCV